jgi:hypothetical protein
MSKSCGYASSCPEPVNVNISQTILQIKDSPAMHRVENFLYSPTGENRTFALQFFPYEPRSVEVYQNSGAQRYGIDYTVQGQYVIMITALQPGDSLLVRYLSVDGTVSSQASSVGMLVSSAGTQLDGFLRMDGLLSHAWADYLPLRNFFWAGADSANVGNPADTSLPGKERRDGLLLNVSTSNFTLVFLQDTVYDGTSLKSLNKFISLGAGA